MTTFKSVAEKAADLGQDVRESMQDLGENAGRRMHDMKKNAGNMLHAAAATMRDSSSAIENAASGAAKHLDAAGAFVKECNVRNVGNRIKKYGRNHPTGILIGAAVAGFIVGTAFSRTIRSRA